MPIASSNYVKLHEHSKSITMPCRHWELHDKHGYVEWDTFRAHYRNRITTLIRRKQAYYFDIRTDQKLITIFEESCQKNKSRVQICWYELNSKEKNESRITQPTGLLSCYGRRSNCQEAGHSTRFELIQDILLQSTLITTTITK